MHKKIGIIIPCDNMETVKDIVTEIRRSESYLHLVKIQIIEIRDYD